MASPTGQSHSIARPSNHSFHRSHAATPAAVDNASKDDPLQPLRAMADRVGKEVERFAERVDEWHTHGNHSAKAKHQSTLRMVGKFKDLADSKVKELNKQSDAENKGELQKSVRRRIQTMAEEELPQHGADRARPNQSVVPSIESSSIPPSTQVQELRHWQTEAATWDLLRIIIGHYHPEPGVDVAAEKISKLKKVGGAYRYSPNSEIWNRFLLEDDQAKEKELVLRWLQQTAKNSESDIESITEQLEAESGKDTHTWTSGWLDTKSKIKQTKRLQGVDKPLPSDFDGLMSGDRTQTLVTHLDPDAPARQKRALEQSDEYYERALWMVCYEMLRRGVPWEKISDFCKERNEAWRGVSVGAAYESHPEGGPNIAGPTVGYLFRRMCFYAAKGSRTQYEGAVYGLLSGDLKEVEPVCRSWDDQLYARYNALLLSRFDAYLVQNHEKKVSPTLARKFVFQDAVANLGAWESSSAHVIEILKRVKATAAESMLPMKQLQGSLISQSVEDLIFNVGVAIAITMQEDQRPTNLVIDPESDPDDPQPKPVSANAERELKAEKHYQTFISDPNALRVLVHTLITLREGLGLYVADSRADYRNWAAMDNVIVAYIEFLRITKRIQLIPLYAAQLQASRPLHCLARILPDIKSPKEQSLMIELMTQYGIDPVEVITQNYRLTAAREFRDAATPFITRYPMLESTVELDYLWPEKRIKREFSSLQIEPQDEELIETLRWQIHLQKEVSYTFENLASALTYLLLHGRIGAAETIINEMSTETLSHIKTQAYCGYAFDFMAPGAEQQDTSQVTQGARQSLSNSGRTSLRPSDIPSAAEHAAYVQELRAESQNYYELQQLVRVIILFREWREEEDNLITQREQGLTKVSVKKIKDIFEALQVVLEPLLDTFMLQFAPDSRGASDAWHIKKVYIPEIILAYITVVQAAAYFTNRDLANKAMDIATLVADEEKEWLQSVFLETGRMTELVDMLAMVARAMLKLNEHEGKGKVLGKKRGGRGESLKIWDVNVTS